MRLAVALPIFVALAVALAALAAPSRAEAHVAPAVGDNNRYLKLSLLGDRIRLAYTVFYGEVPGAALRKAIDTNHDGAIDDAESQAFAGALAPQVAAALEITIDGVRQPVRWSQVVVGLGTPQVAAGAFSVDLVASLCLAVPRGKHAVLLRDDFKLDRPGETEVKAEDSPGVAITESHIDGAVDEEHDYKLVGPSGALADEGLALQFTTGEHAAVTPDATCPGPSSGDAGAGGFVALVESPTGAIVGAALLGAAAAALTARWARRRRQRARRPSIRSTGGSTRRRRADR